jgi:hypothetical protein
MQVRAVLVAVLLLAAPASASTAAQAAPSPQPGPQGVAVTPAPDSPHRSASGTFVELGTVTPSRTVTDAVVLTNAADTAQQTYVYGADAIPSRGGGFAFTPRIGRNAQVGRWLRVATPTVTLPAHGSMRVTYRVTVPTGTPGGEYVGGIVTEPIRTTAGSGLTTVTRFAMSVYLRVPGGTTGTTPGRGRPNGHLVITKLQIRYDGSKACPTVSYRNDSQDILDPSLQVRTSGPLGGSQYRQQRTGAVLPDSSADVRLPCIKRPLGPGRLEVRLSTPKGDAAQAVTFTWLPLPLVISLLLLLLLIGALVTTFLRGWLRRRSDDDEDEDSERSPI